MGVVLKNNDNWSSAPFSKNQENSFSLKLLKIANSAVDSKTAWFVVFIIGQSVLLLPILAVLIFYLHVQFNLVLITIVLYAANILSEMRGSGIRILVSFFCYKFN